MSGDAGAPNLTWVRDAEVDPGDEALVIERESAVIGAVFLSPSLIPELMFVEPKDFVVAEFRAAWSVIRAFAADVDGPAKMTPASVAKAAGVHPQTIMRVLLGSQTTIGAVDTARLLRAAGVARIALKAAAKSLRFSDHGEVADALQRAAATIREVREGENYGAAQLADRFLGRLSDLLQGKIAPAPTTGIPELDARMGGLVPENLVVLAGRPGMGKTVFTMSVGRQAAQAGSFIGFFSLEIGENQFTPRMIADAAFKRGAPPIFFSSLMRGSFPLELLPRVEQAADDIEGLTFQTSFTPNVTVPEIHATAERWQERAGRKLDGIVVDYSSFVKDSGQYSGNENKQVGEIFRGLKIMAKRMKTCVLAVHQLNRGVESRDDKRPTMSDLRGSGEIEQDADSVLLLFRNEYYLKRVDVDRLSAEAALKHEEELQAWRNRLDVISDKNRAGAPGTDRLFVDVGCNALRSLNP